MVPATEEYLWKTRSSTSDGLPLGRCLWAGAESDATRIIVSDASNPDVGRKRLRRALPPTDLMTGNPPNFEPGQSIRHTEFGEGGCGSTSS